MRYKRIPNSRPRRLMNYLLSRAYILNLSFSSITRLNKPRDDRFKTRTNITPYNKCRHAYELFLNHSLEFTVPISNRRPSVRLLYNGFWYLICSHVIVDGNMKIIVRNARTGQNNFFKYKPFVIFFSREWAITFRFATLLTRRQAQRVSKKKVENRCGTTTAAIIVFLDAVFN